MRAKGSVNLSIICFCLFGCADPIPEERGEEYLDHLGYSILFTDYNVDLLHHLRINEPILAEAQLEGHLYWAIKGMSLILESGSASEEEWHRIHEILVRISVLHEKHNIARVQESDELKAILSKAQEKKPKLAEQLRCKDWSKPTSEWKDGCS